MSDTNEPIPSHHKDLIDAAIVAVDAKVDSLGHGPSYEDVAEESGVGIEVVKQHVGDLVADGILKHGTLGGGDDEFTLTPKAEKWRRHRGI